MKYFLHLGITLSLLFIGEKTTALALQFGFLTLFCKEAQTLYLFYLPLLFLALMKLFASSFYILYFFNLFFIFYFLGKNQLLLECKKFFLWSFYMLFLFLFYRYNEALMYDFYLWLDMQDSINHLFDEIVAALVTLHIMIFLILSYNREKIFRKW